MRKKAKIVFHKCLQDSQNLGGEDEHMTSRVYFSLEIDNKKFENLSADIKQVVSGDFEKDSIEVNLPNEYKRQLNYEDFRNAVERYYRSLIGSQGKILNMKGNDTRMRENEIIKETVVEFNIDESNAAW